MSAPQCCIKCCDNTKVPGSKFSFHHMRFDWTLELQSRNALKDSVHKKLICSNHFKPEQVIERNDREFLVPNAVPSLHLWPEKSQKKEAQKTHSGSGKKKAPEPISSKVESVPKSEAPESLPLYGKHQLRQCSVRWKNITLKCAGPNCGLINSNHVYVAQVASSTLRPRYVIICERHRDVTDPETYAHLSQRLGAIISLKKDSVEVEESESEMDVETSDRNKRKAESMSPAPSPKKKMDIHVTEANDQEKSDKEKSEAEEPQKVTPKPRSRGRPLKKRRSARSAPAKPESKATKPDETKSEEKPDDTKSEEKPIEKKSEEKPVEKKSEEKPSQHWRSIFKRSKRSKPKSRKKRGGRSRRTCASSETSSTPGSASPVNDTIESNDVPEPKETPQPEEEPPIDEAPSDEPQIDTPDVTKDDNSGNGVICLDSDSNEDPPNSDATSSQTGNILLDRTCCIPGCKSAKIDGIVKVGIPPDFEYLVVCHQHRDCFKNTYGVEDIPISYGTAQVKHGAYILEEGEVPPSPPSPPLLDASDITLSDVEKASSGEGYSLVPQPVRGETIPVQRVRPIVQNSKDAIEVNDLGQTLVSRKCIMMTGPSGMPRSYILEEWDDGSIIYKPAPKGLPLGNCTKEQVELYKTRQTAPPQMRMVPSTSHTPPADPQILSPQHLVPSSLNPNPDLPIADVSKSELVYIQGKPFLLTSVQGLMGQIERTKPNHDLTQVSNLLTQPQPVQPVQPIVPRHATPVILPSVSPSSSRQQLPMWPKVASVMSLSHNPTTQQTRPINIQDVSKHKSPFRPISHVQRGSSSSKPRMNMSKNCAVTLMDRQQPQQTSQEETILSDVSHDLTEPEEILSDPIPMMLTRVDQGPSKTLHITQKSLQNTVGKSQVMRRLPQKTSVGNQEIKFSIVPNSPVASKKSNPPTPPQRPSSGLIIRKPGQPPVPQQPTSGPVANSQSLPRPPHRSSVGLYKLTSPVSRPSPSPVAKSTNQPAFVLRPSPASKKPNQPPPPQRHLPVQEVKKPVASSSQNWSKVRIAAPESDNQQYKLTQYVTIKKVVPLPSVLQRTPIQRMSKPTSLRMIGSATPQKPIEKRPTPQTPVVVRATRQTSNTTPPSTVLRNVTPRLETKPEPKSQQSTSNVIKVINLNKSTPSSSDDSPFSLQVTKIPAINDDINDDESQDDDLTIQDDIHFPSDPLSFKTVDIINLDDGDPLGDADSLHSSSSSSSRPSSGSSKPNGDSSKPTSSKASSSPGRHGSLPFPSKLKKQNVLGDLRSNIMKNFQSYVKGRINTKVKEYSYRFFEISHDVTKKSVKSMPIYFCEPCDIIFSTAMRLIAHLKLCTETQTTEPKEAKKIYICKRCQWTSNHIPPTLTHVRRCTVTSRSIFESIFTCYMCKHTCASLGEIDAHFDVACPQLHRSKVKKGK